MQMAIDTSVLVGLLDSQDIWYTAAVSIQREKHRELALPSFLDRLSADWSSEAITWILPDVPRLYGETIALI
jgi:hypothetical protein